MPMSEDVNPPEAAKQAEVDLTPENSSEYPVGMNKPKKAGRPLGQFQRNANRLYDFLYQNQKNGNVSMTDVELSEVFNCSSKQISRYLHLLKEQQRVYWTIRRAPLTQKSWFTKRFIRFGSEPKE